MSLTGTRTHNTKSSSSLVKLTDSHGLYLLISLGEARL